MLAEEEETERLRRRMEKERRQEMDRGRRQELETARRQELGTACKNGNTEETPGAEAVRPVRGVKSFKQTGGRGGVGGVGGVGVAGEGLGVGVEVGGGGGQVSLEGPGRTGGKQMSAKLTAKVEQEKQEDGVKSPTWRNAEVKEAPPTARSPVKSAPKEPHRQKENNGRTPPTNGHQEVKREVNGKPEAPWRQGRAGAGRKEAGAGNKEAGGSRREEQLAKVQEFLADPRSQGAGEPVALDVRLRKTGEQGKGEGLGH